MALSKTTKHVLIGGGAALAVFLIYRKMTAPTTGADKPTGVLGGVLAGAKDVYDVITGSSSSSSPDSQTTNGGPTKGGGVQSPPTWNSGNSDTPMTTQQHGYYPPLGIPPLGSSPYATIAVGEPGAYPDALGTRRTERMLSQPTVLQSPAQRAITGDIRNSYFGLPPVR